MQTALLKAAKPQFEDVAELGSTLRPALRPKEEAPKAIRESRESTRIRQNRNRNIRHAGRPFMPHSNKMLAE